MRYFAALLSTVLRSISVRFCLLVLLLYIPSLSIAHDIPSRVTVYAFVKPEGTQLTALLRVPMEAFGEISFPLRGPGYI
ncbi:MAG TPA: hypothetical protein QGF41_04100, partial [Gammaproteobacteria bacterium]|nr:hypothetical protein [Gammaproteobacteria bacterium]